MWRTLVNEGRFVVMHEYENANRAFDASYGEIIIPPLEDDEYVQFIKDINTAVNLGPLIVSIFSDASGTIFVKDTNGNDINLRNVKSTSYTYPYVDTSGNMTYGIFEFTFDDGSTFGNNDLLNYLYWYYIQGVSDMNNLLQWT
jgi:hypothetical protein